MDAISANAAATASQIIAPRNSSVNGSRPEASRSTGAGGEAGEEAVAVAAAGDDGEEWFMQRLRTDGGDYSKALGFSGALGNGVVALSRRASRLERATAGFCHSLRVNSMP